MSGQISASSSLGELRPNLNAQPEPASGSFSDTVALVNTLGKSSGMLLPALVAASPPGRAAKAVSVGILLYLASVGIIAIATIGVFFGIGFFLLARPTEAMIANDATAKQGSTVNRRRPEPVMRPRVPYRIRRSGKRRSGRRPLSLRHPLSRQPHRRHRRRSAHL